jgi:hypothetical protein
MGAARLVPGGALQAAPAPNLDLGSYSSPIVSSGRFSLGTTGGDGAFGQARGHLSVGGYMAYGLGADARLASSLRSDGGITSADVTAAYAGSLGIASVKLGTVWAKPQAFSPNPLQLGLAPTDPFPRPGSGDINLTLSLMKQVTPAFSVGGVAEAIRPSGTDLSSPPGFMLGASLGYRF